jgi:serine/threonine protein kinase
MQNQTLLEGYILQEYQIIKVLGQGDFGITYLAWDINLHKNIVIKEFFIKGEVSREPNTSKVLLNSSISKKSYSYFLDKFISEARILASINHPNIVKVTRFFKANNTGYFVMDYMEGKTLESYIRNRGSLDEKTILRIIEPILNGLSVVHSKNFLHRDIAPDNIYLTKNGIPMLIDFGAVKNIIANESKSIAGVFKVGYSPTEQYFLGGEHTKATDIYSLGAVIAYMILGKRPIEASQRDYLEEDPLKKDLYAYKNI